MLPQHLTEQFWKEVEASLAKRFGENAAKTGVHQYRATLKKLRTGDAVYHQGVEVTVNAIEIGAYLPAPSRTA